MKLSRFLLQSFRVLQRDLTHPEEEQRGSKVTSHSDSFYLSLPLLCVFCQRFPLSQKSQNQLILGVMAIDVSLEDIKRLTPRFTVKSTHFINKK